MSGRDIIRRTGNVRKPEIPVKTKRREKSFAPVLVGEKEGKGESRADKSARSPD